MKSKKILHHLLHISCLCYGKCRVVEERKPDFDAAFSIKCIKTVIPSWHRKK